LAPAPEPARYAPPLTQIVSMIDADAVAPDFALQADDGRTVRLSDFRGRYVVLFFYPKDDTPG